MSIAFYAVILRVAANAIITEKPPGGPTLQLRPLSTSRSREDSYPVKPFQIHNNSTEIKFQQRLGKDITAGAGAADYSHDV